MSDKVASTEPHTWSYKSHPDPIPRDYSRRGPEADAVARQLTYLRDLGPDNKELVFPDEYQNDGHGTVKLFFSRSNAQNTHEAGAVEADTKDEDVNSSDKEMGQAPYDQVTYLHYADGIHPAGWDLSTPVTDYGQVHQKYKLTDGYYDLDGERSHGASHGRLVLVDDACLTSDQARTLPKGVREKLISQGETLRELNGGQGWWRPLGGTFSLDGIDAVGPEAFRPERRHFWRPGCAITESWVFDPTGKREDWAASVEVKKQAVDVSVVKRWFGSDGAGEDTEGNDADEAAQGQYCDGKGKRVPSHILETSYMVGTDPAGPATSVALKTPAGLYKPADSSPIETLEDQAERVKAPPGLQRDLQQLETAYADFYGSKDLKLYRFVDGASVQSREDERAKSDRREPLSVGDVDRWEWRCKPAWQEPAQSMKRTILGLEYAEHKQRRAERKAMKSGTEVSPPETASIRKTYEHGEGKSRKTYRTTSTRSQGRSAEDPPDIVSIIYKGNMTMPYDEETCKSHHFSFKPFFADYDDQRILDRSSLFGSWTRGGGEGNFIAPKGLVPPQRARRDQAGSLGQDDEGSDGTPDDRSLTERLRAEGLDDIATDFDILQADLEGEHGPGAWKFIGGTLSTSGSRADNPQPSWGEFSGVNVRGWWKFEPFGETSKSQGEGSGGGGESAGRDIGE